MQYYLTVLAIIAVLLMSFGIGGRGSRKDQMVHWALPLGIGATVLAFFFYGWQWALGVFIGTWLAGTIGSMLVDKKYHGIQDLENGGLSSDRQINKMVDKLREEHEEFEKK